MRGKIVNVPLPEKLIIEVDKRRGAVQRATYLQGLLWDSLNTKRVSSEDILLGKNRMAIGIRGGGKMPETVEN